MPRDQALQVFQQQLHGKAKVSTVYGALAISYLNLGQITPFNLTLKPKLCEDRSEIPPVPSKVRENFPGGPGVRTRRFHCRERGFDPCSGN